MTAVPDGTDRRSCPACGSGLAVERGTANSYRVLRCRGCGTLYTDRLPPQTDEEDYDAYYTSSNLDLPAFLVARLDEVVAGFSSARGGNRWLDVGFGAGGLMQAAARAEWRVDGVEVSRSACEHVARLGFPVFAGTLAEARYPDAAFDVVSAIEVLEHVPEPRAVVDEVRRVLRPGGVFWATTPHGRGISARLLGSRWSVVSPPEHLQLFSARGMRTLLRSAGFGDVRIDTHGTNPFEIYHVLRGGSGSGEDDAGFDRVKTSYALNAALSGRPSRRLLKNGLNGLLNASRMGDSLKVHAR